MAKKSVTLTMSEGTYAKIVAAYKWKFRYKRGNEDDFVKDSIMSQVKRVYADYRVGESAKQVGDAAKGEMGDIE